MLPPSSFTLYVAVLNCKVAGTGSLSRMVRTAVLGVPRVAPPVALASARSTVVDPLVKPRSMIGMVTSCVFATPSAQFRVWVTLV